MILHNNMARIAAETMLNNWKHGVWNNDIVSQNVFLSKSSVVFPSPDAAFHDPDNELYIAVEFKPSGETKRGILTGLGQSISYLNNYSMSYFICPEYCEGFKIIDLINEIFRKNSLNQKIPLGLLSYKNDNPAELDLVSEILFPRDEMVKPRIPEDTRYWAKYVDATPDLIWTLLDIAFKLDGKENRRSIIWKEFFDKYYFPKKNWKKLQATDSLIRLWDGTPMHPLSRTVADLKNKMRRGLSRNEAVDMILQKINHNFSGDNLYNSYRKNYFPLLDHLRLWDEQGYLTDIGYELHKIGKLHGPTSNTFRDYLARTILIEGKHLDLILDIERSTRNGNFNSSEDARKNAYSDLENKGLVKKNINRSVSGGKKYFSNEFQLWTHLKLVDKNGSYYVSKKGFKFNWEEITRIISL